MKPPPGSQINWGDPINRGLVGRWLMNEGGGNTLYDMTGNSHMVGLLFPGFANSKFGKARHITTGSSRSFSLNASIAQSKLQGGDFDQSYTAWVKFDTTPPATNLSIFGNRGGAFVGGLWLQWLGDVIGSSWYNDTVRVIQLRANALGTPTVGQWYFLAVTYSKATSTGTLYVDAKQVDSAVASPTPPTAGSDTVFGISTGTGSGSFDGIIDLPCGWRRCLTTSEILRLYREPFAGIYVPRRRSVSTPLVKIPNPTPYPIDLRDDVGVPLPAGLDVSNWV